MRNHYFLLSAFFIFVFQPQFGFGSFQSAPSGTRPYENRVGTYSNYPFPDDKKLWEIKREAKPVRQTGNFMGKSVASMTSEEIISNLKFIESPSVGFCPTAWWDSFIPIDEKPRFAGGVIGKNYGFISPLYVELVKRGVSALPIVIENLSNSTPTQFSIPAFSFFSWKEIRCVYYPKDLNSDSSDEIEKPIDFSGTYTVKVGDICFAVVGQITGLPYVPIRYQPTAGLVINSPIESPILRKRIRQDWHGIKSNEFIKFLENRILNTTREYEGIPFLKRLRFYYNEAYENLRKGPSREKIIRLEFLENWKENR